MFTEVEKYCCRNQLLQQGNKIIIACSGGPDSLALVLFFLAVREKWHLDISVAHFEHGIRGEDSVADANFVRDFCFARDLKFYLGSADVPVYAKEHKISVEMAARFLRYAFLQDKAKELGGALIATAHHADDQAETVLMRILRGTGVSGLAAIRPRSGNIIRPFLCISKTDCESCCRANGVEPRYDVTNDEDIYLRNRLRNRLLPLLKDEYNPSVSSALCQLAELAAADADFISQTMADVKAAVTAMRDDSMEIDRREFQKLHTAQQRALLMELVIRYLHEPARPDFGQIERLRYFIAEGRTGAVLELPSGIIASAEYDKLIIRQKKKTDTVSMTVVELSVPGRTLIPDRGLILEADISSERKTFPGDNWAIFDYDKLSPPFFARGRKNGDRIKLKVGTKKIKDLLIDLKVPREKRAELILVTDSENILWLGGVKRAALALADENTRRFLLFRLIPEK